MATTKQSMRVKAKQALENRKALAEARRLKEMYETSAKFDVVVPLYDLKDRRLTLTGKWIKATT